MKAQTIIPPEDGWEAQSYYVVEVAMRMNNPIFCEIFYTGFLSGSKPGGYNKLLSTQNELKDVRYLKVIRKINSEIDNRLKMVKDAVPEYLIVQDY